MAEPTADPRLMKFQTWYKTDNNHCSEWRKEAKKAYDFVAGRQWDDTAKKKLEAQQRPAITFNHILPVIRTVVGSEIQNRQELKFFPRGLEDSASAEVLTLASDWMADQAESEDEQSDAFEDAVICGLGWIEQRLDTSEDPEGEYVEERLDPLEMRWDSASRKRNLLDSRRRWRVRTMPLEEAKKLFPGKSAEQLHASWADGEEENTEPGTPREDRKLHMSGVGNEDQFGTKTVTIVHVQWWERETRWVIQLNGERRQLTKAQKEQLEKSAQEMGQPFQAPQITRKRFRQAFLGNEILEESDLRANQFSWKCITGERDRNKGHWFGMVRPLVEPQEWSNKWLSQTLDIMNKSAKGGIMAEKGVFDDQRAAEQSWARTDAITLMAKGALSGGKVQPKPQVQLPAGFVQLMEFAIDAIPRLSSVNPEMQGLRDINQPGVLEAHRKRAAMTTLARLFNSLRRMRRAIGEQRLYHIQNDFSDGRILRVIGPDGADVLAKIDRTQDGVEISRANPKEPPNVVETIRGEMVKKFDVIIDESPTSPNQKEMTWAMIGAMPQIMQQMITPEIAMELLRYSPFPESLVQRISQTSEGEGENQLAMRAQMLALQERLAEIEKDLAQAAKSRAEATKTEVETQLLGTQADPNISAEERPIISLGA